MTAKLRLPDEEPKDKPKRRPIPDHIPRMEVDLTTGDDDCGQCGGGLRRLGEDVTEELEYVPGRFIVNRIVRPRFACSSCEAFTQAALPSRPIAKYQGWMHADGYAGFEDLYRSGDIREVACMAHVRRKFVDIHRAQGSAIADEAIGRIAQLYAVEKEARGSPPDNRIELRQAKAKLAFDDLEAWLHTQLPSISGKSPLAGTIRYALTRMARLRPYLDHGILELDNNTAERAMRSVAIGRKNYLFVGSQTGGKAAAIAYTLIETAKLNDIDPQAWLADTLARIPDYKINRVDDLLPWKTAL